MGCRARDHRRGDRRAARSPHRGSSKVRFTQTLFQSDGTEDDLSFRDPEGTTTDRAVGPTLGGIQGTTDVSIRTFTGLYAVSFTF